MLVLSRIVLILDIVAGMGLCLGFVLKTLLIIQGFLLYPIPFMSHAV